MKYVRYMPHLVFLGIVALVPALMRPAVRGWTLVMLCVAVVGLWLLGVWADTRVGRGSILERR